MLGELLDHRDHPSPDGRMAGPAFDDDGSESLSPPAKQRHHEHVPGVREERCESRIRVGVDGTQELARALLPGSRHRPVDPDRDVGRETRLPVHARRSRSSCGDARTTPRSNPKVEHSSSRSTRGMSAASGSVSTRATIAESRERSCFCLRSWRSLAAANSAVPRANTHNPAMVSVAASSTFASMPAAIRPCRTPDRAASITRSNSSVCHRASFSRSGRNRAGSRPRRGRTA